MQNFNFNFIHKFLMILKIYFTQTANISLTIFKITKNIDLTNTFLIIFS